MNEDFKSFELHNDPHSEWKELCALATADEISVEEREKLQVHLAGCAACRQIYDQYVAIVCEGMPALGGVSTVSQSAAPDDWDRAQAKRKLFSRVENLSGPRHLPLEHRSPFSPRRYGVMTAWGGVAAALTVAVGLGGYTLGRRTMPMVAQLPPPPDISRSVTLDREKTSLNAQLQDEAQKLQQLQREGQQHQELIVQLQAQLAEADQRAKQLAADKTTQEQTLQSAFADRDTLVGKLRDAQQNYESAQAELVKLRTQRTQDILHYASLEVEVTDLNRRLREQDKRVSEQTQYLASDRDIRELMGARQLYIADVTDVDSTGNAKKAFGRVFYTKGKSLIFYAFDLDQQPGLKNVSTFQAWARQGSDNAKPASLGIFYVDNEANRRWVLRTDDPKVLEQINSVFVTVEPKGGSQKPTGKPLLYAYLRSAAPNHP